MSASIYPFRELMLICQGCGGERLVPQHELDRILSAEDLQAFTSSRIALYSCRCGGTHCDLRIQVAEAAQAELDAAKKVSP